MYIIFLCYKFTHILPSGNFYLFCFVNYSCVGPRRDDHVKPHPKKCLCQCVVFDLYMCVCKSCGDVYENHIQNLYLPRVWNEVAGYQCTTRSFLCVVPGCTLYCCCYLNEFSHKGQAGCVVQLLCGVIMSRFLFISCLVCFMFGVQ